MKASDLLHDIGRPVAYYPGLVKHLGSVNAVLFFCQLCYWTGKEQSKLGIYKTAAEFQAETGMTKKEQMNARAKLRECGVLVETEKRLEHRIYYKLDVDRLNELMEEGLPQVTEGNFGESPNGTPPSEQTAHPEVTKGNSDNTETTPETTGETTPRDSVLQTEVSEEESEEEAVAPLPPSPAMGVETDRESVDEVGDEAKSLLDHMCPFQNPNLIATQLPAAREIVVAMRITGIDPMDLLRWNRVHRLHRTATKKDKDYALRTPTQFLAALRSDTLTLLNDYENHDWNCEICKEHHLVHTRVRLWREQEAQERERKAREREARWALYEWPTTPITVELTSPLSSELASRRGEGWTQGELAKLVKSGKRDQRHVYTAALFVLRHIQGKVDWSIFVGVMDDVAEADAARPEMSEIEDDAQCAVAR